MTDARSTGARELDDGARPGGLPRGAGVHARVVAIHRSTAEMLRAAGDERAARQAELWATAAQDRATASAAAERISRYGARLRTAPRLQDVFELSLDGAIAFLGAEFGNVQLARPGGGLRIVAQRGFGDVFLDHFAVVEGDTSACGRAAASGAQVVIPDVSTDPGFAPHRAVAAVSGFRAVQSTPLIDRAGRVRGMLSTHFRRPHRPTDDELRLLALYGQAVAAAIARLSDAPPRAADAPDPFATQLSMSSVATELQLEAREMLETAHALRRENRALRARVRLGPP